jgi:hypothetical protein
MLAPKGFDSAKTVLKFQVVAFNSLLSFPPTRRGNSSAFISVRAQIRTNSRSADAAARALNEPESLAVPVTVESDEEVIALRQTQPAAY